MFFKGECPQAYSYAYDDLTSLFSYSGVSKYTITFCPWIIEKRKMLRHFLFLFSFFFFLFSFFFFVEQKCAFGKRIFKNKYDSDFAFFKNKSYFIQLFQKQIIFYSTVFNFISQSQTSKFSHQIRIEFWFQKSNTQTDLKWDKTIENPSTNYQALDSPPHIGPYVQSEFKMLELQQLGFRFLFSRKGVKYFIWTCLVWLRREPSWICVE